jgi:hypothetical protein
MRIAFVAFLAWVIATPAAAQVIGSDNRVRPVRHAGFLCGEALVLEPGAQGARNVLRRLAREPGTLIVLDVESGAARDLLAEEIATALGRPLLRTTLAEATGPEPGGTEAHLQPVLSRAEEANAVLFLDEADALFGGRREVAEAMDRFPPSEIPYLMAALREHTPILVGARPEEEPFARWRPLVQALFRAPETPVPGRQARGPSPSERTRPLRSGTGFELCIPAS